MISIFLLIQVHVSAESLTVTLDPSAPGRKISPYVVGLHQVYTFTPDSVFSDGRIAAWANRSGVSASRFPGGTIVKHWDWENPTGQPFINSLDPAFDPNLNPPETEWMSLDEFLEFARSGDIEPFFGVNASTGSLYNLEAEGIAKAVRMVRYVKDRGFGGGLWYIGNEEAHHHGGTVGYAQVFHRYAEAMKEEDPDIRIFWNSNNPTKKSVQEFLANDGGSADGLETHGKWPFGGDPGLSAGTFEEWLEEVPLRDRKNGDRSAGGRIWRDAAEQYRGWAEEVGRELLIANNEYGLGKGQNLVGFSRYTTGLLMTEFLMEHFIGDWFSTCFWDLTRGTESGLLDSQNGYRLNPFTLGMNMLADCQGGIFQQTVATSHATIHGFSAKKDDVIILYLVNKSQEEHLLEVTLNDDTYTKGYARQMKDSTDGYGQLVSVSVDQESNNFVTRLPPLSFTEVIFTPDNWKPKVLELEFLSSSIRIRWNSIPGQPLDFNESPDMINWTAVENSILPDNFWTERQIPGNEASNSFYRIESILNN